MPPVLPSQVLSLLQQEAANACVEVVLPEVETVTEDDACADCVQMMLRPPFQTGSDDAVALRMLRC